MVDNIALRNPRLGRAAGGSKPQPPPIVADCFEHEPRPRVAEFFAGIGLVRLALERQGFRVAFANDIDPDKLEIYRDNFGAGDFHLGDIHQLDAAAIPDCELFTASFPCNDLSLAGARAGLAGGQSSAFWGLVRILECLHERRPPLVMLENVPGFLNSHGGKDFEAALMALTGLGYACDAFLLDAAHFVPQSRLRMFVVAKQGEPGGPALDVPISPLRPTRLTDFIEAHPRIRWNLAPLPPPPMRECRLEAILERLPAKHPAWWSRERADYFMGQLSDRHAAVAKEMIEGRSPRFATAFRRVRNGRSMAELRTDGIAGCLRTPRGGSGRQILFQAGGGRRQVRLLTARECARLQGAPDSFKINVGLNQALFGFGDAVCVPAVEWIAEHYLLPSLKSLG
ncbi:MAG TPA: DNA cytosine methyltransferase [Pirellulales bacterium]|nr:DNA cytosine methyltransferase [Pirellulales bacterium]